MHLGTGLAREAQPDVASGMQCVSACPSRELIGLGDSAVALALDTSNNGVVAVDLETGEAVIIAR